MARREATVEVRRAPCRECRHRDLGENLTGGPAAAHLESSKGGLAAARPETRQAVRRQGSSAWAVVPAGARIARLRGRRKAAPRRRRRPTRYSSFQTPEIARPRSLTARLAGEGRSLRPHVVRI